MTLERLAGLITDAAGRGRAVPAFHVVTLEQAEAITGGAADASGPVILQVNQNALGFRHGAAPRFAPHRSSHRTANSPPKRRSPLRFTLTTSIVRTLRATIVG